MKWYVRLFTYGCVALFLLGQGFAFGQQSRKKDFVPGQVIVKFRRWMPTSQNNGVGQDSTQSNQGQGIGSVTVHDSTQNNNGQRQGAQDTTKSNNGQVGAPLGRLKVDIDSNVDIVALNQVVGMSHKRKVFQNFMASDTIAYHRRTGRRVKLIDMSRVYLLSVPPNADVEAVAEKYRRLPQVEHATPNYRGEALEAIPNDPGFSNQEALNQGANYDIDGPEAWDVTTGSNDITIAILDSGVDYNLTEFGGGYPSNKILAGYDFKDNDTDPMDIDGHGTRVATIAAALTNNGYGMSGVAGGWGGANVGCRIMPVRVLQGSTLDLNAIISGVNYARENGADVINMSIGHYALDDPLYRDAIWNAHAVGIVVVTSSGNDNVANLPPPQKWSEFITVVGGSNSSGNRYGGSNYGWAVDVVARATNVTSFLPSATQTSEGFGTSFAAPQISGIAALMLSLEPTLDPDDIENILQKTAMSLPQMTSGVPDYNLGYGLAKARAALDYLAHHDLYQDVALTGAPVVGASQTVTFVDADKPFYSSTLPDLNGTYTLIPHEYTANITFPQGFASPPDVWFRSSGTKGWPEFVQARDSEFYIDDCHAEVVAGTLTNTGCVVKQRFYEVKDPSTGALIGIYPADYNDPGNRTIAYTASGLKAGTQLFSDYFEDGNANGWGGESGTWSATSGQYTHSGSVSGFTSVGSTSWTDYAVDFKYINARDGGVLVRAQDVNNAIVLIVRPNQNDIYWHVRQNGSWGPQYENKVLGHSSGATLDVKVVASGNTFTAYVNGIEKTSFTNSTFASGKIGFYALGGQGDQAFDDVVVEVDSGGSWTGQDIGYVQAAGSYTEVNGTFTVYGSGQDIWDYDDEFYFVHQPLSGDGWISAKINYMDDTNEWAKVGVMIRESTSNTAAHAMMVLTPDHGAIIQGRQNWGSSSIHPASTSGGTPRWVMIKREGNNFTGYVSNNSGASWDAVGAMTANMGTDVLMGLCVTSHNDGVLNMTIFDNVSMNSTGGSSGGGGITNGNFEDGFTGWTATGSWKINGAWTLENGYDQPGQIGNFAGSFPPESGTGTLTSDVFIINKDYLNFRIGGQDGANANTVKLIIDGAAVKTTYPPHDNGFIDQTWNISAWNNQNKSAYIVCEDANGNGSYAWFCVDEFRMDDSSSGPVSKPVVLAQSRASFQTNLPDTFKIGQNSPNPFNPETTIRFALPRESDVKVIIYNVLGQEVRRLVDAQVRAGYHNIVWDSKDILGRTVSSGVYFYRFIAGPIDDTQKMLILK